MGHFSSPNPTQTIVPAHRTAKQIKASINLAHLGRLADLRQLIAMLAKTTRLWCGIMRDIGLLFLIIYS